MNRLVHALVIAPFVLAGALPAAAAEAPCAPGPATLLKMADAGAYNANRGACAQTAQSNIKEWRIKLDKFEENAKVDSKEAQKSAVKDLNAAWTKASDAAAKLETTRAADWESAKVSFNKASDELAATWSKVRAEVK